MRNVPEDVQAYKNKANHEKRQRIVNSAKAGVRNRRGLRMQVMLDHVWFSVVFHQSMLLV